MMSEKYSCLLEKGIESGKNPLVTWNKILYIPPKKGMKITTWYRPLKQQAKSRVLFLKRVFRAVIIPRW